MRKRIWFISILVILVSATLAVGFCPAALAQKAAPADNPASSDNAYNTVPPPAGYYCPMGTGYPNMTSSPNPGYKNGYFKRDGYRDSRDSGRQGYRGPHRMGCNWY